MDLAEIGARLERVSNVYAEKFNIRRDDDWFILKIQEELGELSSAYLKLTSRGRRAEASEAELEQNLREEIADVLAMTLLFARSRGIDAEQALAEKWFKYLTGSSR